LEKKMVKLLTFVTWFLRRKKKTKKNPRIIHPRKKAQTTSNPGAKVGYCLSKIQKFRKITAIRENP